MKKLSFSSVMLWFGLFFLYAPMLILVIYSFNESKLVTVWGGFHLSGTASYLPISRSSMPYGPA